MTGVNAKIRNKSSHSHRAKEEIQIKIEAKSDAILHEANVTGAERAGSRIIRRTMNFA